jgi:hypothetical protein
MRGLSKKINLCLCLVMGANTIAFSQQGFTVGFGGAMKTTDEIYGVNTRVFYAINEHFCFGPEASIFPFQEIEEGLKKSIVDINLNAHYIFEITHKLGVYPLSGINYTLEEQRLIEGNEELEEVQEIGLNYGFGTHYKMKNTFLFAEFKGVIGSLSAEFITVGIILNLIKKI